MTAWTVAVAAATAGTVTVAQAAEIPDSLMSWLTGSAVSVLAFGIISFVRGWIVPGRTHDRVVAERDAALRKVDEQSAEIRQLVMPMLAEVTKSALAAGRGSGS